MNWYNNSPEVRQEKLVAIDKYDKLMERINGLVIDSDFHKSQLERIDDTFRRHIIREDNITEGIIRLFKDFNKELDAIVSNKSKKG